MGISLNVVEHLIIARMIRSAIHLAWEGHILFPSRWPVYEVFPNKIIQNRLQRNLAGNEVIKRACSPDPIRCLSKDLYVFTQFYL